MYIFVLLRTGVLENEGNCACPACLPSNETSDTKVHSTLSDEKPEQYAPLQVLTVLDAIINTKINVVNFP